MHRKDVSFLSENLRCAGWWYAPPGANKRPFVVMAHGIGATRELGLDAFARSLCDAGLCVLAFDYRHYGGSEGSPRELLSVRRQQADYRAALAYARAQPEVDPQRAVLWGVSLSGGHVLSLAAQGLPLSAVIAQVPFVSAAHLRHGAGALRRALLGTGLGLYDIVAGVLGHEPVYLPLLGPDNSLVAMPGAEHERGYRKLVPPEVEAAQRWRNRIAFRSALRLTLYEPARNLPRARVPILIVVGEHDTLCPTELTRTVAARSQSVQLVSVPGDHFDCFAGQGFEDSMKAQLAFLRQHQLVAEGVQAAAATPTEAA